MNFSIRLIFFLVGSYFLINQTFSQTKSLVVPMKTEKSHSTVMRSVLDFTSTEIEIEKTVLTPTNLLFKAKKLSDENDVFELQIDTNGNKSFKDEKKIILRQEEKIIVKALNNKLKTYQPVVISFEKNRTGYSIFWRSDLQAKGHLKIGKCRSDIYLQDYDFDGLFEMEDGGTNLQIDRNNDGKIWGKEEHLYAKQVFEFCGNNYVINKIAENGSYLTLSKTNLKIARVGGDAPDFDLFSITGKPISSKNLIGKPYLIDFWATWCSACIEKMPEIKQVADKIQIVYVNTDSISRKNAVVKLAEKLQISDLSASGFEKGGEILFKSYMRLENGLPLYVLINADNKIIYAGSGGTDLSDLKRELSNIGIK